jgi:hypothetical protein
LGLTRAPDWKARHVALHKIAAVHTLVNRGNIIDFGRPAALTQVKSWRIFVRQHAEE